MRKLFISGLAVASLTGIVYGQATAPTFTPLPWYDADGRPQGTSSRADPAIAVAEADAVLRRIEQLPSLSPEARAALTARASQFQSELGPQNRRIASIAGLQTCALPDETTRPVNTKVTFNGWSYLCVEVLDSQLTRQGVAWMRVAE